MLVALGLYLAMLREECAAGAELQGDGTIACAKGVRDGFGVAQPGEQAAFVEVGEAEVCPVGPREEVLDPGGQEQRLGGGIDGESHARRTCEADRLQRDRSCVVREQGIAGDV